MVGRRKEKRGDDKRRKTLPYVQRLRLTKQQVRIKKKCLTSSVQQRISTSKFLLESFLSIVENFDIWTSCAPKINQIHNNFIDKVHLKRTCCLTYGHRSPRVGGVFASVILSLRLGKFMAVRALMRRGTLGRDEWQMGFIWRYIEQ